MYRSLVSVLALIVAATCAEATEPDLSEYRDAPEMSAQSAENLYLLGKVWGYLKYHHPRVTAGCFDWDEELLEIADDVAAAESRDDASTVLAEWVHGLNDPGIDCGTEEPANVHFSIDKSWVGDESLLGAAVTGELAAMGTMSGSGAAQHYVSMGPVVRNPQFQAEDSYGDLERLDWRYRLLALFRFWNIIEYWFPYNDLITADWDEVLKESVPRFVNADGEDQYVLELMALIALVQDGHSHLWSAYAETPPAGTHIVPAHIRSIEGLPVVWRVAEDAEGGLAHGDVILAVDDVPVSELIESWSPYYGVSNEISLLRETYRFLLRGQEGSVSVRVERDGRVLDLNLLRTPVENSGLPPHDRDGDTLQMLSDDIVYLKLSSVSQNSVSDYLDAIAGRSGMIVDIRNYPSAFMVFALGQHLVKETTPFAKFTYGDLESPGTFNWTDPVELTPAEPFFDGRIVILIDESSQSSSEYTAMAFRTAPNAIVIGSQTAGADGNISAIPLPGNHRTTISGIGVFYPDGSPTQQIGIVPDIVATPTIEGVRAGRDEVLERAVIEILGHDMPEEELLEMTRIPHAPATQ